MDTIGRFREWFWRPPRAHGDIIRNRVVSPVELLYDLVYVVVIAQAAHTLAVDVSAARFAQFVVVFGMIWVGWVNGSLYLDLHGREDGRTRSFVFVQMGILALLAVFTGGAVTDDGPAFAFVYAAFLAVLTWLWITVRRYDAPEFMAVTKAYAIGMLASVAVILGSAFVPPEARLVLWALYSAGWIGGMLILGWFTGELEKGASPTHSTVERFGLFTIIVLGEVVFGVVEGLSSGARDALTIATGVIALIIGLGFWWIYFDIIGGRFPRNQGRSIANWMLSHFPITLSIVAAGAGMVSLMEHAHDPVTPEATAWLVSGAVALGLVAAIVAARALDDGQRIPQVYRKLSMAMAAAALGALAVGLVRPAPWILVVALGAIQTVLWFLAVKWFIRARAWPPG
ncbi:MAG: low temperature requirement protein A [Chloroflexota bacterium]